MFGDDETKQSLSYDIEYVLMGVKMNLVFSTSIKIIS